MKSQNDKDKEDKSDEENPDNEGNEKKEIDIMEKLHKKKMYVIEQQFSTKEKGLKIDEFVQVMLEHLDYNKESQEEINKITLALIELFKEIDVNGDGTMEWDEFSNHIIELGLLRNDRSFKNVIKQYFPSDNIKDEQKHETGVEKVYFFDRLKMLLLLERDSPRFKVYNANNAELIWNVNAHKGSVLSAEFIPDQNLIATSSNDLTINFWDSSSFNLKQILSVPEIQLCMRYAKWSSTHQSLIYTGGSDSIIHIYDTQYLKEKGTLSGWNPFFKKDTQQYGHASPIGDILPIDSQSTLVTAGLDGNICLWDITTHSPKKELRGHEKGVYSLDWSDWSPMNQCLISAGLDHEAFVWNTYVKEKIFLLRGHNHPLVGVKCLPRTPQVITADISGMVKIWDVRNFICIQTFNVPTDEVQSFTLTYPKKQIVVGARKLYFYEYDEPKDQLLTDEKMCLRILFNSVLLCFITLHPDSIKVWDARTGKLQSVYRELSSGELTVIILDQRQRKLFVGDSEGRIFTVNIKNGAKMKKFEKHSKMITDLAHWTSDDQAQRRVVSVSREETVNIHDEDSQDAHRSCRYQMKQHRASVNSLSIRNNTELLASCSDDGSIFLTNLLSYRQELLYKPQHSHQTEMKKVLFLDPYDCLVATDSVGTVYFVGVGMSKFKQKVILEKVYRTTSLTNREEQFPIMAIAFLESQSLLLLGDELGNIKIWDLSILLEKVKLHRVEEKKHKVGKKKQEEDEDRKDDSNFFETAPNISDDTRRNKRSDNYLDDDPDSIFNQGDIEEVAYYRKAHYDGITWIEICHEENFFATSSFDCCCYIWMFHEHSRPDIKFRLEINKVGSLILGQDKYWGFRIDEESRKTVALNEASEMLDQVKRLNMQDSQPEEVKTKTSQKEGQKHSQKLLDVLHERAFQKQHKIEIQAQFNPLPGKDDDPNLDKRLKNAKKALEFHYTMKKKTNPKNLSQYDADDLIEPVNFVEGLTKDLFQHDEFEDEEEDYNILNDLQDYKNQQLQGGGAFTSKNAFKTKLIKGHHKISFK